MYVCRICCVVMPDAEQPRLCEVCQELPHFEQQLLLALNRIGGQLDNLVEIVETSLIQEPSNGHDRRP
jgi:hypothetical protein